MWTPFRATLARRYPPRKTRRSPPRVEELEERDRVLPRDAEEVLDVPGADLLALAEHGHELRLDRVERPGVEEERLLDAHQPPPLDEHLEELVLLVAPDAGAPERLLRARRRRLRAEEVLLDLIHGALLLGGEAYLVGGEPHLVALRLHDALRLEGREERREDALVRGARPSPELLTRHAGPERVRAVEGLEHGDRERAQVLRALGVDEPVAVHDEHAAGRDERVEQAAQPLGAEGRAAREGGEAHARGADVADVLLEHRLGAAGF